MVEDQVRKENPDYDELERISINYMIRLRKAGKPFSVLLFVLPVVLFFVWILFIESTSALVSSIGVYLLVVLLSIYSRYRSEKKFRRLNCSFPYYLVHSDSSMYTIRIAAVVLSVLVFILVETHRTFSQREFLAILTGFLVVSFALSIFSPRFHRYRKLSSGLEGAELTGRMESISRQSGLPEFTISVIPERRMKVANAYCTGIVRNRVFITDYLLDNLNVDEASSILAHELGHVKFRHNLKTLIVTFIFLSASMALYFSYMFIENAFLAAIMMQAGIMLFIFGIPILVPAMRRSFELQADAFSFKFFDIDTVINALLKTNYLNMTPAQMSGGVTHPPLLLRIKRIRNAAMIRGMSGRSY